MNKNDTALEKEFKIEVMKAILQGKTKKQIKDILKAYKAKFKKNTYLKKKWSIK